MVENPWSAWPFGTITPSAGCSGIACSIQKHLLRLQGQMGYTDSARMADLSPANHDSVRQVMFGEVFLSVQQKLHLPTRPYASKGLRKFPSFLLTEVQTQTEEYTKLHSALKPILIIWKKDPEQVSVSFYNQTCSIVPSHRDEEVPSNFSTEAQSNVYESGPKYHLVVPWNSLTTVIFPNQQTSRPRWLLRMSCPSCALSWHPATRTCVMLPSPCSGYCPSTRATR